MKAIKLKNIKEVIVLVNEENNKQCDNYCHFLNIEKNNGRAFCRLFYTELLHNSFMKYSFRDEKCTLAEEGKV